MHALHYLAYIYNNPTHSSLSHLLHDWAWLSLKTISELPPYLEDIEDLGKTAGLSDAQEIKAAIHYTDLKEAELWEVLPEAFTTHSDRKAFVNAVKYIYPGCEAKDRYCRADLHYLIQGYQSKPMWTQDELGSYHWTFLRVFMFSFANRKLAEPKGNSLFLAGFSDKVAGHICNCLEIIKLDLWYTSWQDLCWSLWLSIDKSSRRGSNWKSGGFKPRCP